MRGNNDHEGASLFRAVLLDLGGVYYTEGFRDGLAAIATRLGVAPGSFQAAAVRLVYETGYVTGSAPEGRFWTALAQACGLEVDLRPLRDLVIEAFQPRPGMAELVAETRQRVPVVLVTDQTNWLYEIDDRDGLLAAFDAVVSSYEEGYSKRDEEIFRVACQRAEILPEEGLFFDDNPDNVATAAAFGLSAVVFSDPPSARRTIAEAGLLDPPVRGAPRG